MLAQESVHANRIMTSWSKFSSGIGINRPSLVSLMITSNLLLLLLLLPSAIISVTATSSSRKTSIIDFSYLHRTKSSLLSRAVKHALHQSDDIETDVDIDIDVSASFIEKNIEDLLSPLMEKDTQHHRRFGIIAQRNQWTNKEATLLLQSILGPENDDTTTNQHDQQQQQHQHSKQKTKTKKKRKKEHRAVEIIRKTEIETETILGNETISSNVTSPQENTTATSNNEEVAHAELERKNVTVPTNYSRSEETKNQENSSMIQEEISRLVAHSLVRLDLGWNYLGGSSNTKLARTTDKAWHQILQRMIRSHKRCPTDLRFPVCGLGPAACRAIGKGLMARYEHILADDDSSKDIVLPPPLCLSLIGNEAIGDPGVAALSAAIRTVTTQHQGCTVLDTLDLSACGITDAGAEALAIALENNPFCIRHLDLSNNQITNVGAAALGRALAMHDGDQYSKIETLDLSNNKGIEDAGAKALALALQQGAIASLILRSCHVHADGAAALAKSLKTLASSSQRLAEIRLDLSGNPLGILRKKPKSGGGKYSATALRSKATATTAAYMSLIGKTVQKGLKDLGIAESIGPDTLESDDEEESQINENDKNEDDPSKVKCGALAIADALLLDDMQIEDKESSTNDTQSSCKVFLGLRHCALDTRASEALAAVRHEMLVCPSSMDMMIDVEMNNVLEQDTVAALRGDLSFQSDLNEMAERYLEAMEALKIARQRSMNAAKIAQSRMQMEREREDEWGEAMAMGDDFPVGYAEYDNNNEDAWDSDAEYDEYEDKQEYQ